jgi:hypothetical protein
MDFQNHLESDFDRQKVNEVLKQHDEELDTFIAGNSEIH